ncbi:helix-turn-helix transcriptional regulator [uncultured Deefgea sp.]|uniref:ArsR/SmtB family transcription factor n=1 Tax=uncultured Deefgea sp. TaxID=1304914 RepID=UPI0025947F80|nr:helix-turn-helix domain-containing protein [uncultured Deefgea sp.]
MEIDDMAGALKELGHPTRLALFKLLVQSGPQGLYVGDLQQELQLPGSTLNHHLRALISVGLLQQVREGRMLRCTPQFARLEQIIQFLQAECCIRVPQ